MLVFVVPAVALGVAVLSRRGTVQSAPAAPPPAAVVSPSPIAVFVAFLNAKQTPPDLVIHCAIQEAQLAGNVKLVEQISAAFPEALARITPPGPPPGFGDGAAAAPTPAPQTEPAAPAAPTAPAPVLTPSPIAGISDDLWRAFCERLIRQAPDYNSERRIGRYAQRKDRLREIGFDPDSLADAPDAQDVALSADLADVHRHLVASGDAAENIGKPVMIPDLPEPVAVTLSGLLGIASVAGLEDMASWLTSKADRRKFPNTTAAFMRTNGIF